MGFIQAKNLQLLFSWEIQRIKCTAPAKAGGLLSKKYSGSRRTGVAGSIILDLD
ncbi:MAG: hypothetical protein RR544_03680 [Oscillospiraceae bacterium]